MPTKRAIAHCVSTHGSSEFRFVVAHTPKPCSGASAIEQLNPSAFPPWPTPVTSPNLPVDQPIAYAPGPSNGIQLLGFRITVWGVCMSSTDDRESGGFGWVPTWNRIHSVISSADVITPPEGTVTSSAYCQGTGSSGIPVVAAFPMNRRSMMACGSAWFGLALAGAMRAVVVVIPSGFQSFARA